MALPLMPGPQAMRATMRMILGYRWRFAAVVIIQIAATCSTLIAPQLLGHLVTEVSHGKATVSDVNWVVGIIVVATIAGALINAVAQKYARILGEAIFAQLRERMMSHVVHLPLSAVEQAGTGDLVGRTTNDISHIEYLVRNGIPQITMCVVTVTFTFIASLLTNVPLSLMLLVIAPPVVLMMRWYLPKSTPAYRATSAAEARLSGVVSESAEQLHTVDALTLGATRERRILTVCRELFSLELFTARLRLMLFSVLDIAWRIPVPLIMLWGAFLASRGWASLGAITTVTLYAMEIRKPIGQLMYWIDLLQVSQASLSRILGVELVPPDRHPTGREPSSEVIEVRDVCFSYHDDIDVLHDVSLRLHPGERLAVVGPSGSGKSTLGRMLAGINAPTRGHVTVGGVDLTELTEAQLRSHVALVTQEHHVFSGTIAENIRLARPQADDEVIRGAIEAIGAQAWVDALPDGMHTMVGSGHRPLTPAQAQELALARLVLLDPHTLILDEATSLLDPQAARALERTLSTALAGRTVIEVAHRLYTAQDADRVAVMIDGRIVELGSHEELVAAGGEYARLWQAWSQE